MNCVWGHLKAREGRRSHGKDEPKTTAMASMDGQMNHPPARSPLRVRQVRYNTLQPPLLHPVHFQLHT